MTVYTFAEGSYVTEEEMLQVVECIIEQLKLLPQRAQTHEAVNFILDQCLNTIKSKRLIL